MQVVFIDIQTGAIESLKALIHALDLIDFASEIQCCNAMDYSTEATFDLVILESMQHGFSREGHLKIAMHFSNLINAEGKMLPEQVSINACLGVGQQEFIDQWKPNEPTMDQEESAKDGLDNDNPRINLGEIFNINLDSLKTLNHVFENHQETLIKCNQVSIPDLPPGKNQYILLIFTEIQVGHGEVITEYQSGITHPLPELQGCINFIPSTQSPGDLLVEWG